MKRILAWVLTAAMAAGVLSGCGGKGGTETTAEKDAVTTAAAVTEAEKESASEADTTAAAENVTTEAAESENAGAAEGDVTLGVGALKVPTAMGMVKLMDDAEAGNTANRYEFTIAAAIDEITPKIVQGQFDIAAMPANVSSVLYNNTDGAVSVLAINTLGVIYIVETGDSIQSVADLKGKTIYASGKGATPEYALNYVLKENGIDPEKDVTIEYKSEHAECAAALAEAENGIAMLPQPFVTTAQAKNDKIRIALDMTEEWEKVQTGEDKSSLLTGVVVVRNEFLQAHPEAVAAFMDEYKASTEYVNANVEDAAALIEKYDIIPAAVAKKALPYCNITFIEGEEMKTRLGGYLGTLAEQNADAVGGKLPDEGFYYIR